MLSTLKNAIKRIQAPLQDMHLPALQNLSLKLKISLPFCLIILLVLSTFWLLASQRLRDSAQANMDAMGTLMTRQTAETVTELLLANDQLSMNVVLGQLVRNASIDWAAIYDVDNLEVAAAGTLQSSATPLTLRYAAPIALQDSIAGHLELSLSPRLYLEDRRVLNLGYASVLLAGLAFSLAAGLAMASLLTHPLRNIQASLEQPEEVELEIDPERLDEIGALQRSCQRFLDSYHQQLTSLYGDNNPGQPSTDVLSSRTEASLLAIRVCNFSTLLALLNPSTLSRRLDEYYSLLNKAGKVYGGRFHRFTGDSLILAFDHHQLEEPTFNAVCCGQLFQLLVKKLNKQHRHAGAPTLDFSAVIHSGEVLVSHAGDPHPENGSKSCASVMGLSVDEALQLTEHLQASQVSVTAAAMRTLDDDRQIDYVSQHELELDTDKPPLMYYILKAELQQYRELLYSQVQHILPGGQPPPTS